MGKLLDLIPAEWRLGVLAALLAALLVGVGYWQRKDGRAVERAEWLGRENQELRDANDAIDRLNREARAKEAAHAGRLAQISADHQKEIQHAKVQRDRDLAAARAGTLVLRIPSAPGLKADPCAAAALGPGAGRCDGGTPGELPREVTADLLALINDADDVARQLARAQQVIVEDRRMCFASGGG